MTFELTILGSSSAIPTSEKYPTAHVLNVHERFFLIDCGEGTQIRLRQFKFSFDRIRHIFISHLHGDHFLGLPGFISTRNLLGIRSDLHLYAHSELKRLIQPILDHLKRELGFRIVFHPLNFKTSELIYSDSVAEVHSFPLKHSIPCCGFRFSEKKQLPNLIKEKISRYQIPIRLLQAIKEGAGFTDEDGNVIPHHELSIPPPSPRSYAFCSDTAYHEPVAEFVKGADLLYHEATFLTELEEWAGKTLHSTAAQAATIARNAEAKKLIIGHFSTRYKDAGPFLLEARAIFPETEPATDGATFRVSRH
jgi:ribonuclease Z